MIQGSAEEASCVLKSIEIFLGIHRRCLCIQEEEKNESFTTRKYSLT